VLAGAILWCGIPNLLAVDFPEQIEGVMDLSSLSSFQATLTQDAPPAAISAPLEALWWDAKGDWSRAHELVDELETPDGMAVHAYLHRKEGEAWNADYWYRRAGRGYYREELADEWASLAGGLLAKGVR
jgi:hypothetical protein